MQTQEITSKLTMLPIFKGMGSDQMVVADKNGNPITTKTKGKGTVLGTLFTLAIIGTALWGLFTFIIPKLFAALGIVAYYGGIVIGIVALVIFFPVLLKWLNTLARKAQKGIIENDPFIVLDKKREEIKQSKERFGKEKANIEGLQKRSENNAYDYEQKAHKTTEELIQLNTNIKKIESKIQENLAKEGEAYKEEDDFHQKNNQKIRLLGEATRKTSQLEQFKRFVQVYGIRGLALKNIARKFSVIEIVLDEKQLGFDSSLEMLKEEFKFSRDAKDASLAAKSAMGLSNKWEVDYALEVATNTIEHNINETVANLNEISKIATMLNHNIDDEQAMAMLEQTVQKIESGNMLIPQARSYKNTDYRMTQEDSRNAGQFGRLI